MDNAQASKRDFIRSRIDEDQASGRWGGQVVTRFPPEPNGYLHIGHAKAVLLNFGLAREYGGVCRLRFDDTNPSKEDAVYVERIIDDVAWLTGIPIDQLEVRYASDYFQQMYEWAVQLIEQDLAYVDDQNPEALRRGRGTVTSPGVDSPFRSRSVAENLQLFAEMRAGQHPDGSRVLRAKIDMAHPNMLLRDPLMYRIQHAPHHRTGSEWSIYPLYDWAHGLEDSLEGVTHSCCSLEFQTHRPLYDWFLDQLGIHHPQQIEFNRLNLTHTVMSKRRLLELVEGGYVDGWDDPRLPTIAGLRRRGVPPEAIATFIDEVGYTRTDTVNEWALFEHHLRKELNARVPRSMAVLQPLPVIVDNWGVDEVYQASVPVNPEDPASGERPVPFRREILIEQEDFMLQPVKKFFRLAPNAEVRLRGVGFLRCTGVDTDADGAVVRLHAEIDRDTLGCKPPPDGRKVKATLHWLSVEDSRAAEIRLYEHLFTRTDPTEVADGSDWKEHLDPASRLVLDQARIPLDLDPTAIGERLQFERLGYFCIDPDSTADAPVLGRIATLRDSFGKGG